VKSLLQIGLCCLLAPGLFAATHGGGAIGGGHPGGAIGAHRGGHGNVRTFGFGRYGGYGFGGYGFGGYGYTGLYGDYYEPYPAPAEGGLTVVYPPAPPPPPAMAAQTAHGVIHEYGQPSDYGIPSEAGSANQPPLYLIAFRDSTIRAAMTYWVADGTLHYMDRDHKEQQAPFSSVDRDLSTQLNRERHVPFNIP
jgi:hypothetical protein